MDNHTNEFNEIENAAADKRRQQDFDDLNNERSGNEVGRIGRFISSEERQRLVDRKQGKPSKAMSALEAALMNNPVYAAAYTFAMDETRAAQNDTQSFLEDVELAISKADLDIKSMMDTAVTLPDGHKAFMGKDGIAWTEDGEKVDEALAAGIDWTDRPSHED